MTKPKIREMKRKMNPDYEPKERQKREKISEKLVKNAPEEIRSGLWLPFWLTFMVFGLILWFLCS